MCEGRVNAMVYGRRRIAAELSISQTTLKSWEANPLNPVKKYLSRAGNGRGRVATTSRLLSQLRDELAAGRKEVIR